MVEEQQNKPEDPVPPKRFFTLSLWALIAANCIPIVGAVFFGWDTGVILAIYWSENLVVGFYNLIKMALACGSPGVGHLPKLFLMPFFCVHFGGFCAIHGVFILLFSLGINNNQQMGIFPDSDAWPGPLMFVGLLVGVVQKVLDHHGQALTIPIVGLMVSHGVSLVENFFFKGEFREHGAGYYMAVPYGRIVVTHIAIIAAALPVMLLRSPLPLLIILIALKTVGDVFMHKAFHSENAFLKGILEKVKEHAKQQA